jgi:hypothetical protein
MEYDAGNFSLLGLSGDCYPLSQKIGRYVGTSVSSNLNQKSKVGREIGWRTGSEDGKSP